MYSASACCGRLVQGKATGLDSWTYYSDAAFCAPGVFLLLGCMRIHIVSLRELLSGDTYALTRQTASCESYLCSAIAFSGVQAMPENDKCRGLSLLYDPKIFSLPDIVTNSVLKAL